MKHYTSTQFARRITDALAEQLGPNHPDTLDARFRLGWELGMAGDPAAALACMKQLMPHAVRLYGAHDRKTLDLKRGLANWTGHAGDPAAAIQLYAELVTTYAEALGHHDRKVFDSRDALARWTAEAGDYTSALRLRHELVVDMERAHAPRDDVIGARYRLAYWATKASDYDNAQNFWRRVIADAHAAHGRFHITTLEGRSGLAECIGKAGDSAAAVRLLHDVIADSEQLGPLAAVTCCCAVAALRIGPGKPAIPTALPNNSSNSSPSVPRNSAPVTQPP
ncbi:MAG: hypothetical protein M3460_25450 [Actinomycetota bacterium]|nr:hypothetical protein [Actinomycetota bacterium]